MDAADLALRLGHRRHRVFHALSALLSVAPADGHLRGAPHGSLVPSLIRSPVEYHPMTVLFALALQAIQQGAADITPRSAFVNPRIVTGAAALVTASVLLLLYVYRRRLFILWWIGGWLLLSSSMFLVARPYANAALGYMAYGGSQLLGILSALSFVIAADAYRHRPLLRREYAVVLLPVAIWFTLGPVALETKAAFAPGHLLIGGALVAAGAAHLLLLREVRMLGAALVGITLVVL